MSPRWPIIVRSLFRIIAGSALVPAFLVAGLLSVPASCQCGTSMPHDHSLFAVASHTHAPASDRRSHPHPERDHADDSAQRTSRNDEVQVVGSALQRTADVASGQVRAIAVVLMSVVTAGSTEQVAIATEPPACGCVVTPERPPPQA
jgi:hypothetical protein